MSNKCFLIFLYPSNFIPVTYIYRYVILTVTNYLAKKIKTVTNYIEFSFVIIY